MAHTLSPLTPFSINHLKQHGTPLFTAANIPIEPPIEDSRMNQVSTRPDSNTGQDEESEQMPVMQHLITLRKYLFKIVGITLLLFFCLLPFRNTTYQLLSDH